jgi:branched-chain amino acid transport system substrate-binding protein
MGRVLILVLAFCLFAAAPAAGPPVEIPVILSLTGAAAFLGQAQQSALEMLAASVNADGGIRGRPVHFAYNDDTTSPQVALQLANQIEARKAPVILGLTLTALCRSATAPLAKTGPVVYCTSPGMSPAPGSYVFAASSSYDGYIGASLAYFHSRGLNRIAILHTTDSTGQEASRVAHVLLSGRDLHGMTIVDEEVYAPSDLQVTAQVTKILASGAQAVVVWTAGAPFATAMKALHDAGNTLPIVAGSSDLNKTELQPLASILPDELLFQGPPYLDPASAGPEVANYLKAIHAAGRVNDFITGIAWDPGAIIIAAFKALGPNATSDQIRTYIAALNGYRGISGLYDFRKFPQRGIGQSSMFIVRWDKATSTFARVSTFGGAALK